MGLYIFFLYHLNFWYFKLNRIVPRVRIYDTRHFFVYSKTCVQGPLSKRQKMVFKTDYRLMQVKSIAECSKGIFLQCFRHSLSNHSSLRPLFCLFLSGRLHRFYCNTDNLRDSRKQTTTTNTTSKVFKFCNPLFITFKDLYKIYYPFLVVFVYVLRPS